MGVFTQDEVFKYSCTFMPMKASHFAHVQKKKKGKVSISSNFQAHNAGALASFPGST